MNQRNKGDTTTNTVTTATSIAVVLTSHDWPSKSSNSDLIQMASRLARHGCLYMHKLILNKILLAISFS